MAHRIDRVRISAKTALGALAVSLLMTVAGCGGGDDGAGSIVSSATTPSSGGDTVTENRVTGSVGDGPIVGARMRVRANSGAVLMETESSSTADYDITIKTQGKNYAVTIEADQGLDLVTGMAPDFRLVTAISRPNTRTISNLNPFTTLIFGAAQKAGGLSDANVEAARAIVVERYGFGLDPATLSDPTNTRIDGSNVHIIVKTSETLGEMIRRTRDALITTGQNIDGDAVVARLSADLSDGWIDGRGASGFDARTAAVANVASAAVLLQAMANRLHVYGVNATSAMDNAIRQVRPETPTGNNTSSVAIPAEAFAQAARALQAAKLLSDDPRIEQALQLMLGAAPGSRPTDIAAALPSGIDTVLEQATLDAAFADETRINQVNITSRGSDYEPDPNDPSDPGEPAPEPEPDPGLPSPGGNNPPTISGAPNSNAEVGRTWSFQPKASDADGDTLTFSVSNKPAWLSFDSKTGRLWGTPSSSNVGTHLHIVISVSDGTNSASLPAFDIVVSVPPPVTGFAKLSWTPPTEREDGTPLEGIGHFTIYYGTSSSNLSQSVRVDGSLTSHQIDDLAQGTWYFTVTATDTVGLESARSAVASKTIG